MFEAHTEVRATRAEALHLHQVSAKTVGEADRALPAGVDDAQVATAQAAWQYPASQRHTDTVMVPPGTAVGGTVTVWVDDAGRKAPAPRPYGELASTAVAAGAPAFGVLVPSAGGVVRLRLRRVEARSLAGNRKPGAEDD
ncbi:hypothetical protein K7B10_04545 [Streptomyces flavotricini]|uniref:Uncharacterized protein n=1 Tax=Streptomyces flavotricini TaxID=66888 RepID=A0ABS8DYW0_9ACTN|nr:hypothetical protein [Streptomyces flavotricini]MCC0094070.1 hypothetical protein [Streptomyces flavotricini]